jgi:GTP cyclohydrolase II
LGVKDINLLTNNPEKVKYVTKAIFISTQGSFADSGKRNK